MREGVTSTGFKYEYDEERLDDMRFVDVLVDVDSEETPLLDKLHGIARLLEMLVGKEQKEALYRHIGSKHDGRVPSAELERELSEIMQGSKDTKNSCA